MMIRRSSIFLKLLGILTITVFVVNSLIVVSMRLLMPPPGDRSIIDKNLHLYLDSLAKEIGTPPDLQRAASIAERTQLNFKIEGPSVDWATIPNLPDTDHAPVKRPRPPFWMMLLGPIGPKPAPHFTIVRTGDYKFFFFGPPHTRNFFGSPDLIRNILLLVTAVLVGSYFALRRLLRPIQELEKAVVAVGEGHFQQVLNVKGHDEIADLGHAFNAMTKRVSDMMHQKEQLLLDVSHELRSPVTRMKLMTEMLTDKSAKNRMTRNLDEMESMISDLLELARLKEPATVIQKDLFDLVPIVKHCCELHSNRTPAIVFSHPEQVRLTGDASRIETIVRNLIDNALKFSSPDGTPIEIHLSTKNHMRVLSVKDLGVGISAEEIGLVFEPFYRVDKSRSKDTGGFGLGLSLCKRIVEAHGGTIHIYSDGEGKGSEVIVMLPE